MNQAIIVVTSEVTKPFLEDFKKALMGYDYRYPIVYYKNTWDNNQYEMGAIRHGTSHGYDEFILLHDSCIVKDDKLFDLMFNEVGRSVSISPFFLSYLGKYRLETLQKIQLPEVFTKKQAVDAESSFLRQYLLLEPDHVVLFPDFDQHYTWQTRHGRMNMVIENEYLIKYKGCWHPSMILN